MEADKYDVKAILEERYLYDLVKRDVDKFERAAILKNIMQANAWDMSDISRKFGVHPSTVRDWLLYDQISPKAYKAQIAKGLTPTDVFHVLRKKDGIKNSFETLAKRESLDSWLTSARSQIKKYKSYQSTVHTEHTLGLISGLVNDLNNLHVHITLLEKKKNKNASVKL